MVYPSRPGDLLTLLYIFYDIDNRPFAFFITYPKTELALTTSSRFPQRMQDIIIIINVLNVVVVIVMPGKRK